jgi:hypothetical protein
MTTDSLFHAARRARFSGVAAALLGLFAATASFAPAPAIAGGATYCVNCSGWVTQLAQQVQQITTAANTAQTVRNTLQQVLYLGQTLKQLDPATLSQMTGQPLDQVMAMRQMYDQLGPMISNYSQLSSQMEQFQQGALAGNMDPMQYLQYRAQLAQSQGSAYQKSYQSDQQLIQSLGAQQQQLQMTAAEVPAVTGQVNGLQQLLAQNVAIQQQLVTMNAQMAKANALAAQKQIQITQGQKANLKAQTVNQQVLTQWENAGPYKVFDPSTLPPIGGSGGG